MGGLDEERVGRLARCDGAACLDLSVAGLAVGLVALKLFVGIGRRGWGAVVGFCGGAGVGVEFSSSTPAT